MCTAIVKYKLTNSLFPSVPFLGRFDYWNNLATFRKLTISPAMDVIRSRFHRICEREARPFPLIFLNLPVLAIEVESIDLFWECVCEIENKIYADFQANKNNPFSTYDDFANAAAYLFWERLRVVAVIIKESLSVCATTVDDFELNAISKKCLPTPLTLYG